MFLDTMLKTFLIIIKIEIVSKCLTDNCSDCTDGYVNTILHSRLVCRCSCHVYKQPVNQVTTKLIGKGKNRNERIK
jgi:hypothetical protein